jgi:antitoxin MazE
MRTRIVRIGNSQGVRIPRPLLEQSGIRDEVELEVEDGKIVIRSAPERRRGWNEAFRSMAAEGDDFRLDEEVPDGAWSTDEWAW